MTGIGMRFVLFGAILGILCLVHAEVVVAQSTGQTAHAQAPREGYDEWNFDFDFRSWVTAIEGEVTAQGTKTPLDISFRDTLHLLDELQFISYGHLELKKGPFGLILDGYYVNMEDQSGLSFAVPVLVPVLDRTINIPVTAQLEVLSETAFLEGALAYDILTSSQWRSGWPTWRLEALAGARYTYLRTRIEANLTGPLGRSVSVTRDGSRDWVDPIVGGRFSWRPAQGWLIGLRSDLGGFTVGADFTWNVEATITHNLNDWLYVNAGYRALYADYEQGSFKYDVWTHGPWTGFGVRF